MRDVTRSLPNHARDSPLLVHDVENVKSGAASTLAIGKRGTRADGMYMPLGDGMVLRNSPVQMTVKQNVHAGVGQVLKGQRSPERSRTLRIRSIG